MTSKRLILLILILLPLGGCIQHAGREEPFPAPEEIVRPIPHPHEHKKSTQAERPSAPQSSPSQGRARSSSVPLPVMALLQEAEASSASGQLDNAAATLERAIRIQPRSALLWQKLADVRLQQNQPGLAEDLAKKSNVLARGNGALTRKNWQIIAEARRRKGDAEGAADADARNGR